MASFRSAALVGSFTFVARPMRCSNEMTVKHTQAGTSALSAAQLTRTASVGLVLGSVRASRLVARTLPGNVELAGAQPVAGRVLERVVVVVPALAEGKEAHPPVVARLIARAILLPPPHVRC